MMWSNIALFQATRAPCRKFLMTDLTTTYLSKDDKRNEDTRAWLLFIEWRWNAEVFLHCVQLLALPYSGTHTEVTSLIPYRTAMISLSCIIFCQDGSDSIMAKTFMIIIHLLYMHTRQMCFRIKEKIYAVEIAHYNINELINGLTKSRPHSPGTMTARSR